MSPLHSRSRRFLADIEISHKYNVILKHYIVFRVGQQIARVGWHFGIKTAMPRMRMSSQLLLEAPPRLLPPLMRFLAREAAKMLCAALPAWPVFA